VAYVHEVLMDSEMEMLMDHGKGHMERSKVGQSVNSTTTEIRTSQNTWLWYESNPWLSKIKQRLEDVTGLSTESAEPLQLVNYGIGGQYEPHFDFMDVSLSSYSDEELIEMFFFSQDDGHGQYLFSCTHGRQAVSKSFRTKPKTERNGTPNSENVSA